MKTKIIIATIFLGSLIGFYSCEEGIPNVELERFMYLSLNGSKGDPIIHKLDLSEINDTVFNINVSYGGTNNFHHGVIEASIEVDRTLVDKFNADHQTNYLSLPEGVFSLSSNKTVIPDGKNSSEPLKLTLKTSAITANEYLLPLIIRSVSGGDIPVHEEYKTLYLVFKAEYDPSGIKEKKSWKVEVSSYHADMVGSNIIDNDINTCWHTNTGHPHPHWAIIDFNKLLTIYEIYFTSRQEDFQPMPKDVVFSVSKDKTNWETALEIEIPYIQTTQTFELPEPKTGRYLKIEILSNWAPQHDWTHIAEIDLKYTR